MKRRPNSRTVPVGQTVAGTRAIIDAADIASNQRIIVTSYLVVMDGGGTFKFQSSSGRDLSDAVPCEDKGGVAANSGRDDALLICDNGDGLNVISTVGAAKGHVTYHIEP